MKTNRTPASAPHRGGHQSVAEWVVIIQDAPPILIREQGTTSLGTFSGWECAVTLATEVEGEERADRFTVTCTRGDDEARSQARQGEADPLTAGGTLQISAASTKKSLVTIAFGPRHRSARKRSLAVN